MAKEILIKPLITEKLTQLTENHSTYGFVVNEKANKIEIKKAVESMYKVKVDGVRTIKEVGKYGWKRTPFGLSMGTKGKMKKAYVTLKQGDSIDFFSNI